MTTPPVHKASEVTTEPQRQALDEMSRRLVQRLNDMINEQNERAQAFARQQHSLSSLPGMRTPDVPCPETVYAETVPAQAPAPLAPAPKTAGHSAPPEPPVARRSLSDAPPLPFEIPTPGTKKKPANGEKSGGFAGCLIAAGTFLLFILLRSCN